MLRPQFSKLQVIHFPHHSRPLFRPLFLFLSLYHSLSFFWSFAPEWASVSNGNGALNQRSKTSAQQRGQLSKYSGRKCVCVCVTARKRGVGLAGLSLVWYFHFFSSTLETVFVFLCSCIHACCKCLKRLKKGWHKVRLCTHLIVLSVLWCLRYYVV